jgi:protein-L-isoaspartate(D-aspartate) O-methyltransferase
VTAAAVAEPPPALVEQLAPGAWIVCPVERQSGEVLIRARPGEEEAIAAVRFVPLVEE